MDKNDYLDALEREKAGYEQAGNTARASQVADEIRRVRKDRTVAPKAKPEPKAKAEKAEPKETAVDGGLENAAG